ncbi:hypothetical protein [Streptomyces sp. S186]|uniref:hypothetical protein n=1 Tax=Streptomyces sp. S186 TaxID=3434395 RepID=UPI003F661B16
MTDPAAEQEHPSPPPAAPEAAESAVWLRGHLLEIASALRPDHRPVVVREWSDPVRLRDPAPIGHRFLCLVCVGGNARPSSPGFDDALNAFTAAGWRADVHDGGHPGESWATARRDGYRVKVYEGGGPGILTFTGWTPVLYTDTERQPVQPHFTLSTVPADEVLCDDCHGWGVCLDCEGRAYSGGSGGYGRCWCVGNNAGPGKCVECAGRGVLSSAAMSWKRKQYGLPEADSDEAVRQSPAEDGHDSHLNAFTEVSQRTCACGEFRCFWRNILTQAGDHLLARFVGTCQGCAARRAYAFRLPLS